MIVSLLINLVILVFGSLFVFLPQASIATIPFIGPQAYDILVSAMRVWNTFAETVPYVVFPWKVLILAILPFEALLLVGKFFLGHRLPANHVN